MVRERYSAVLVSDFNLANFATALINDSESPGISPVEAPFGQVLPVLLDSSLQCWKHSPDLAIVWTQPHGVVKGFGDLLQGESVALDDIMSGVDTYAEALFKMSRKVHVVFVPTWITPNSLVPEGLLEMRSTGAHAILTQMNLRLSDLQNRTPSIHILNTEKWLRTAGKYAYNPKLWYMAKVPFGSEVFREAVADIKSAINGIIGNARKLIVVDLDNTVWGGIVGDLGWERITLGGHDPHGEAFADFQKGLKLLNRRGILLGIVSKNEEEIALEAINRHPEMVLRLDDFAGWRINWKDKAQNLADLVEGLNLGMQSVVFLDDNPVERARIRETFPDVLVPELSDDPMLYRSKLMDLRCFNLPAISGEDLRRTKMYQAERQRTGLRDRIGSVDEWLKSLLIEVRVEELNCANVGRVVQLLNKTNQMNLSTRRLAEKELMDWPQEGKRKLWTLRVSDKFGDSGLTGIMSMEWNGDEGRIVDFVLSCRVMGRKVEETMVHVLLQQARLVSLRTLQAEYLPTAKNAPCLRFLDSIESACRNGNLFIWDVTKDVPLPECIACTVVEGFPQA